MNSNIKVIYYLVLKRNYRLHPKYLAPDRILLYLRSPKQYEQHYKILLTGKINNGQNT